MSRLMPERLAEIRRYHGYQISSHQVIDDLFAEIDALTQERDKLNGILAMADTTLMKVASQRDQLAAQVAKLREAILTFWNSDQEMSDWHKVERILAETAP